MSSCDVLMNYPINLICISNIFWFFIFLFQKLFKIGASNSKFIKKVAGFFKKNFFQQFQSFIKDDSFQRKLSSFLFGVATQ